MDTPKPRLGSQRLMINLKRMRMYHQIWKHFNLRYTIEQIGTTIELIEKTEILPGENEYSIQIWQKYLELRASENDNE